MVDIISGDFQIQCIYFLKVIFGLNTSYGGSIAEVIGWNVSMKQKLSVYELISSPGLKFMKI